jgi:hypothetical protein
MRQVRLRYSRITLMSRFRLLVLTLVVLLALPSIIPAQVVPYGPLPGPVPGPSPFGGLRYRAAPWYAWITDVTLGDFKAGFCYGWGLIRVKHNVASSPPGQIGTDVIPFPLYAQFEHKRDTDLSDLYLTAEWGLESRGVEVLSIDIRTNVGWRTTFNQTTEPGVGQGVPARVALATLWLPDDQEGEIQLDATNRVWSVDLLGALPVFRRVDFLLGYKAARDRTTPTPYAAQVPVNTFTGLPGTLHWENFWTDTVTATTTGFSLAQFFSYHGPTIGGRFRSFPVPSQRLVWHVDVLCAPYLFGTYEFEWTGSFYDDGFSVVGRERTDAAGLWRYCIEARGAAGFNLAYGLRADLTGRFSHLYMEGSEPQIEIAREEFLGGPIAPDFEYAAPQSITLTRNFWCIGGNLVLPF